MIISLCLERVTALLQSTFDVVGAAHNGREMIYEATRLNPDMIVADISMPALSGIEAAHQLRESGSEAPIVFLTIHASMSSLMPVWRREPWASW